MESELFGHEKGAFTGASARRQGWFELADGGTLFLDEVGNTSLKFQAQLLRVLQEGSFERLGGEAPLSVDVRVVCATNALLEENVACGKFREDLFYRINVVPLELVPLRERKDDIPLLVSKFLTDLNQEYQRQVRCAPEDLDMLKSHDWPGNARELQNLVHFAYLMALDDQLAVQHMLKTRRRPMDSKTSERNKPRKNKSNVEQEEIRAIETALQECRGIQRHATAKLGISLRQLRYRIQKYGIPVRKIYC